MIRKLLLSLLLAALMSPSVNGQAKVGTTSARFLEMSPSVRANGMGAAGVALQGHDGAYYNPALLGLFAIDHAGALTFYPHEAHGSFLPTLDSPFDHKAAVLSLPRRWRPWPKVTLGVGFYRTRLLIGTFLQRTWARGEARSAVSSIEFREWAWHGSTSLAYDGPVKVALGLSYKKIHQDLGQIGGETHAFDYGLAASMPLGRFLNFRTLGTQPVLTPTVGISWTNRGPDMEIADNAYDLPSVRRLGAAVEFGLDRPDQVGLWRLIGLTVASEYEKNLAGIRESNFKTGIELGLADAVFIRAGHIDREGSLSSVSTSGFGINSRGLLRLLSETLESSRAKKTFKQIADLFSLEFSYAKSGADWPNSDHDVSYYELALIF